MGATAGTELPPRDASKVHLKRCKANSRVHTNGAAARLAGASGGTHEECRSMGQWARMSGTGAVGTVGGAHQGLQAHGAVDEGVWHARHSGRCKARSAGT